MGDLITKDDMEWLMKQNHPTSQKLLKMLNEEDEITDQILDWIMGAIPLIDEITKKQMDISTHLRQTIDNFLKYHKKYHLKIPNIEMFENAKKINTKIIVYHKIITINLILIFLNCKEEMESFLL